MKGRLSPLQEQILEGFFRREPRFFLTGGAALAGFYLGHRDTKDLDLFTLSDVLDDGERALRETADDLGARVESIRTAPEFRRRLVSRGEESVIVDLVLERAAQGDEEKRRFGAVVVDPPGEILANKLCTLLSRAEIRDLVDALALARAGHDVEAALPLANRKDAGLTPAQLAWVLSEIRLGDDAEVPGGFSVDDLRRFLGELQGTLTRLSFPDRR